MLINNADLLHNQKKLSNCRIQSLCDLLVVNKYHVNPSSRLRNLADGFKESAKNYRNIVRYLSTVDNYITRKVEFMDKVIADFYHAFQYESEILESFMK